jgi:hypothetical protein
MPTLPLIQNLHAISTISIISIRSIISTQSVIQPPLVISNTCERSLGYATSRNLSREFDDGELNETAKNIPPKEA